MYEACPHNQEQCDVQVLYINNQQWGSVAPFESEFVTPELTADLINKDRENANAGIFGHNFFTGFTVARTNLTASLSPNLASDSSHLKVDN